MAVTVEVLGPLRLRVGEEERSLEGRRERLVLALLATPPGRHLADARLVDELWADLPPARASNGVQVAISRLRRTLGIDAEIRRDPAGYTLLGADVDAGALPALADRLPGLTPPQVLAEVDAVLSRWRGTPYAGIDPTPTLVAETARLEECRLVLLEARARALLDLGRPQEAHRLLAPIVPEHPFRETLWSLLALALYRCDRQAEALETLRRLRAGLVEELGVDPSASVRELEQAVLAQDPGLRVPQPTAVLPEPSSPGRRTGVVGRAEAIGVLEGALTDLVDAGRGGVLLLTGDAGMGKTMLATELAHRARDRGIEVLHGRCHEADVAPPYWPWLPVLRRLVAHSEDAPPELAALVAGTQTEEATDAGAAAAATLRTFAAVAGLLGERPEPVVVELEDLHWADRTSLRLVAYLAEELRDRPVLLTGTVRTVDLRQHEALAQALAALARQGARRVPLTPLDDTAVAELLAGVTDEVDPALVEELTRRSDGNPFFVLEMARLLAADDRLTADAAHQLDVPDGIADVLRLRVSQLGASAQEMLGAAAVAGRSFDTRLLSAVLEGSPLDAVDDAVRAGVVEETDGPGELRFVHALTRETVYRDLTLARRAHWHARIGEVLATRVGHDPELLGEVAHHHAAAADYLPELAPAAADWGERAALAAGHRGAYEEATALWDRALVSDRVALVADPARRHRLLLGLASAHERVGEMHGMLRILDEAMTAAQRDGDHARMAEAATAYRSSGVWHWREIGEGEPRAIEVIEECLPHVEDLRMQARLLANLALEYYMTADFAAADVHGRRSLELARQSGDRTVLRDCLSAREVALFRPGGALECEDCSRESLTIAETAEHEITARFHLAVSLQHLGRGREADAAIAPAFTMAARLRHTGSDVPLAWFRWLRAVETEDPEASRIGREALALHRRTTVVGLTELTGLLALVSAPAGTAPPVDVVTSATGHPFEAYRTVVAHALALSGDVDAALRLRGEVGPMGGDYAALFTAALTTELLRLAQDDRLPVLVERIRPYARFSASYGSVLTLGSTGLFVGSGLAALGDRAGARVHLEQAVEHNRTTGATGWEREARARLVALDSEP